MTKPMKMPKQQFLDLSFIVKNKLNSFLESILALENKLLLENLISPNLVLKFKNIKSRLERFEAKEVSEIYKEIIDSTIEEIVLYADEIKEKLRINNINFFEETINPIISLLKILEFKPTPPLASHRIWFGPFFDEKYQTFILNFKKLNPMYTNIIWTDFKTINSIELNGFYKFCNENGITLNNIREQSDLINYDLIIEELDKSQDDLQFASIHYVRASDLARVSILISQGGVYTDTDTDSRNPLIDLDSPFGLILKKNCSTILEEGKLIQEAVLYDFIAANPNNYILLLAAKISRLDYDIYHSSTCKNTLWQTSKQPHIHQHATINLTGSAIMAALNLLIKNNIISTDEVNNLFKDTEYSMPSYYDKSWLKDLSKCVGELLKTPIEKLNAEHQSLLSFISELKEAREKFSPIIKKTDKNYPNKFTTFSFYSDFNNKTEYQHNNTPQSSTSLSFFEEKTSASTPVNSKVAEFNCAFFKPSQLEFDPIKSSQFPTNDKNIFLIPYNFGSYQHN